MDTFRQILQAARQSNYGRYLVEEDAVFESVAGAVQQHMSQYDASHDFHHVLRVVALSSKILAAEFEAESERHEWYRPDLILLSALLHDVNDKKYAPPPSTSGEEQVSKVAVVLREAGVAEDEIEHVEQVVNHVSYSTEVKNPEKVREVLEDYPDLAVVQDADRLDALGAIGVGRMFTYGGARVPDASMQRSRTHIDEKLVKLGGMMKTDVGLKMAKERTERLVTFSKWWDEEAALFEPEL
ncbi:HD domain-containing protein [Aspergillus brunneoviolaceus CBS 621.78]|uniref:HD domain-containing protein n=2 Tax=Aspergillus TaxID=5052 RepID=A0A8G1W1G2_9EURO|nr:HD domain-containing protein [Aspergillus brunneoviolaceus CBS 621.78]XP_040804382.1 HD domain-containing protein [Aspergillus fijiensis CBS 313.89]RAH48460.1 HD domain-containing protein [Aspergillus brunneoviolaceus CBS 621.78]RAK80372.1 HD domain-containing protein [Aspergillus fijiensis CBS 313.89]